MNLRGIIIAIGVLVSVSAIVSVYLALENNIAEQNQAEQLQARVHHFTDNGTRYVKIIDIQPNSAFIFKYPYTENSNEDSDIYNDWVLIRLPSDMGGGKNDISSFRAYNLRGIDPLGLLLRYDSAQEKLDEPHNGDTYEPVNGTLVAGYLLYQRHGNQTLPNALPNLDLGIDDQGYIYVKPSTFEIDKNGVIGFGRMIS